MTYCILYHLLIDLIITIIFTYMYTVYFIFFQVASATATKFGLSRGLLNLQYDQINASESESESYFNLALLFFQSSFNIEICVTCCYDHLSFKKTNLNMPMLKGVSLRHVCISAYSKSDKS